MLKVEVVSACEGGNIGPAFVGAWKRKGVQHFGAPGRWRVVTNHTYHDSGCGSGIQNTRLVTRINSWGRGGDLGGGESVANRQCCTLVA